MLESLTGPLFRRVMDESSIEWAAADERVRRISDALVSKLKFAVIGLSLIYPAVSFQFSAEIAKLFLLGLRQTWH